MDRRTFIKTTGATAAGTALSSIETNAAISQTAPSTVPARTTDWPVLSPEELEPVIREAVEALSATLNQLSDQKLTIDTDQIAIGNTPTEHQLFIARPDFDIENFPDLAILAIDKQVAPTKEDFASWLWLHGGSSMIREAGHAFGHELFCLTHTGYPGILAFEDEDISSSQTLNLETLASLNLTNVPAALLASQKPASKLKPAQRYATTIGFVQNKPSKSTVRLSDPFARNGTPILLGIPSELWSTLSANQQSLFEVAIESAFARSQAIVGGMARALSPTTHGKHAAMDLRSLAALQTAATELSEKFAARSSRAQMIHDSLSAASYRPNSNNILV